MFKRYAIAMVATSATALFALAGCAGSQPTDKAQAQGDVSSAAGFATAASHGLHLDYDKQATPAAAVSASKLIVQGKLVDVTDGISFGGSGAAKAGRASSYGTAVIEVTAVAKGKVATGGKVYAVFNKSAVTGVSDLATAGRNLKVVAALADISGWSPAPGVTVVRPAGMPAGGPLYLAFPDSLWLQGSADKTMIGVHAEPLDIPAAWGSPKTLAQYWSTLEKAAR